MNEKKKTIELAISKIDIPKDVVLPVTFEGIQIGTIQSLSKTGFCKIKILSNYFDLIFQGMVPQPGTTSVQISYEYEKELAISLPDVKNIFFDGLNFKRETGLRFLVKNQNGLNNSLYEFYKDSQYSKDDIRKSLQNYPLKYPCRITIVNQMFECSRTFLDIEYFE